MSAQCAVIVPRRTSRAFASEERARSRCDVSKTVDGERDSLNDQRVLFKGGPPLETRSIVKMILMICALKVGETDTRIPREQAKAKRDEPGEENSSRGARSGEALVAGRRYGRLRRRRQFK